MLALPQALLLHVCVDSEAAAAAELKVTSSSFS